MVLSTLLKLGFFIPEVLKVLKKDLTFERNIIAIGVVKR